MYQSKKFLGVFSLALINVAAIVSLRNLSFTVEYGLSGIVFYLAAAVLFFIPTALVCAELATAWPEAIGVYGWVARAFGLRVGFFAQWMNWMFSIASFPTVLTFLAATIAYLINPELAQNPDYMFFSIVGIFWLLTFINFLGMKASTLLSTIGALFGTVIPGALIILFGFLWVWMDKPIQLALDGNFIPTLNMGNIVFFGGVVLGLAGMEMSAFYANETENPKKVYPKAILLSTLLILLISIVGSLSLAIVVPKISLVEGIMQLFTVFFDEFHLSWAVKGVALLAILGSFAGNNTWVIGPAKGLHHALETGHCPKWLSHKNKANQPVAILLAQATLGTILAAAFYLMPSVEMAFWLVTAITTQFAMIMYALVFLAAIKLRFNHPEVDRPYTIPGGKPGVILLAGIGALTCLGCFVLGFVLPDKFLHNQSSFWIFESYLVIGILALSIPGWWMHRTYSWKT